MEKQIKRFEFECVFRDLIRGSQGRIQSLIVFNKTNEAYFESLTIKMEVPKVETLRIVDRDIDPEEGKSGWSKWKKLT